MSDDVIEGIVKRADEYLGPNPDAFSFACALLAERERAEKAEQALAGTVWPVGFDAADDASVQLAVDMAYMTIRAETAEARVKELEGALSDLIKEAGAEGDVDWWAALQRAHVALERMT